MAACAQWPHKPLDPEYGAPVRSTVPVFLLSGTLDPVSPPHFGAEAAKYLPNGIHVLAPGAHVPGGPCVVEMERAFLNAASGKAVDTSCVAGMTLPPFVTN
jgi:predicted esterase